MGGMEGSSYLPWVLIGLGLLIILGIIVLLMRMRRGEEGENKAPSKSIESTEASSASVTGAEKESIGPLSENVQPEKPEAPAGITVQKVSGRVVSELPVIKEPVEELPGIDRDDFAKYRERKILVVEDNKINQKLILTLLSTSGISLVTAEDGIEALEKLRAPGARFDLVLMDVNMPNMDGLEATREIRKDRRLRDIPVVALTASTGGEEVEAILESGMNAYLDKPINLGKLFRIFGIFIREYRQPESEKEKVPNEKTEKTVSVDLDTEILDLEQGLQYSNNDRGLYTMLLEDFLATYGDSDKKLSQWIREKNYGAIQSMIVDLEGITGTVGAGRLYALTQKIRQVLDRQTYGILPDFMEEYREELHRLKKEAGKYLAAD